VEVDSDSEVVFYYAGHGVQIAGGNYLIPVDADLGNAYDVPFQAVSLSSVVNIIGARARRQMVILDSCRDNPFGDTLVVSDLGSGLVETRDGFNALTAPINSLLAFSTSPGAVSYDGDGANSPFTEALVKAASMAPDAPVGQIFEQVRRAVYTGTEGQQVPWESSTLVEPVSFNGGLGDAAEAGPAAGAGGTRGLSLVSAAQAAEVPATSGAVAVHLGAPLESEVLIGPGLRAALAIADATEVTFTERPAHGRLGLRRADGGRGDAMRVALEGAGLDGLTFVSDMVQVPAETAPEPALGDAFSVAVDGVEHRVQLSLEADPCDAAAGDHLDPEGVGLTRYPNEITPDAALAACLAAVAANPENGRFHYQLGRAHLALRQFDAARADFETARSLGHTRAWVALGNLVANDALITGGGADEPAPAEAIALYREGVDRGDPYAYHALGKQLLRHGTTEAARREGFDLLSRALELGHTFSMNELGYYFLDPSTPYSDPARGLRYLQESAGRGDIYGYQNLGIVYRDGLAGVTADPQAAAAWFQRAAEGGHPYAPGNLGRMWNSGALGTDNQFGRAVEWYDVGLERGDGWSGANGAWIIMNREVPGLGPRDAALRAAKAATLRGADSAAEAQALLAGLPEGAIDGAAQMLVNALGGSVAVDGDFGAGSEAEMMRVLATRGETLTAATPVERLTGLAAVYWRQGVFRVDLY
jgi:TPR repeat protein